MTEEKMPEGLTDAERALWRNVPAARDHLRKMAEKRAANPRLSELGGRAKDGPSLAMLNKGAYGRP